MSRCYAKLRKRSSSEISTAQLSAARLGKGACFALVRFMRSFSCVYYRCWMLGNEALAETGTSTYYVGEPYPNRYSVSMQLVYSFYEFRVIGGGSRCLHHSTLGWAKPLQGRKSICSNTDYFPSILLLPPCCHRIKTRSHKEL